MVSKFLTAFGTVQFNNLADYFKIKKRSEEKYDFNVGDSKRNSRSTLLAYLSLRGRLPPQFSQDLAVSLMTVYKWSLSSPFNYKFEHMYTFIKIIHQFELNLKLFKIE